MSPPVAQEAGCGGSHSPLALWEGSPCVHLLADLVDDGGWVVFNPIDCHLGLVLEKVFLFGLLFALLGLGDRRQIGAGTPFINDCAGG